MWNKTLLSYYVLGVVPLLVGHSGSIYRMHTLDSLDRLGIEKPKAEKCAYRMS